MGGGTHSPHRPTRAPTARSHLGDVGELGLALGDVPRGGHHTCVDDHDVGELGGEAQLDGDTAVEAEVPALRQHWGDSGGWDLQVLRARAAPAGEVTMRVTLERGHRHGAPGSSVPAVSLLQGGKHSAGAACRLGTSPSPVPALDGVAVALTVSLGPLQVPGRGLVPARRADGVCQSASLRQVAAELQRLPAPRDLQRAHVCGDTGVSGGCLGCHCPPPLPAHPRPLCPAAP